MVHLCESRNLGEVCRPDFCRNKILAREKRMEKDITEKQLEFYPDIAADIVNGICFNGRQEIKAEDVQIYPGNPGMDLRVCGICWMRKNGSICQNILRIIRYIL